MIVSDVKVPVRYSEKELFAAVRKASGRKELKIRTYRILKRSIDARKKPALYYVMKLAVNEAEQAEYKAETVHTESAEKIRTSQKPVIIAGAGPAGLFAALTLSEAGIPVLLLERGKDVDTRTKDVEAFWQTGVLDPSSNVQFGEGGAGTFSDGKLNTLTQDKNGLNQRVLKIFYEAGAPEEILYDTRPHIGTDKLKTVVRNLRERILAAGGKIRFEACVTDLEIRNQTLQAVIINGNERVETEHLILAIGHSARDTFYMLKEHGIPMERKPFAVGIRMEHLQEMITMDQYGTPDYEELGAAPYKVTAKTSGGRGVYSFCMCPGGYVVNASSEEKRLAINGMSYAARDGKNANAGIVVQVTPEDYPSDDVLAGVEYQRMLEEKAYEAGNGRIPVQRYGDFKEGKITSAFGTVEPQMKGAYRTADLNRVLPAYILDAVKEAIPKFGRMIKGFDTEDAVLSAVESRTSSPVRILRNENGESEIRGIYPCGEGAGYAGGITSAAMDGIRTAERIIQ